MQESIGQASVEMTHTRSIRLCHSCEQTGYKKDMVQVDVESVLVWAHEKCAKKEGVK